MKEFIFMNLGTILVIAALLFYIGYLIVNRKWAELRSLAYKLIIGVEKRIVGDKVGEARFQLVLDYLYDFYMPKWLKLFVTKEMCATKLQEWFVQLKDAMDNGKLDKSINSKRFY